VEVSELSQPAAVASEPALWAGVISGAVMIAAGVGIWLHPEWFVPLVGAVMIVEGARFAWQGLVAGKNDGLDGVRVVVGLLVAALGAGLWLYPDKTAPFLYYTISGWAIIFGIFIAVLGIKDLASGSGWWQIIVGALLTAFGIAVWPSAGWDPVTLTRIAAVFLVVAGIVRMVDAIRQHRSA
jgi:uncharacterized membrane protein HdeD (DUF308 family)